MAVPEESGFLLLPVQPCRFRQRCEARRREEISVRFAFTKVAVEFLSQLATWLAALRGRVCCNVLGKHLIRWNSRNSPVHDSFRVHRGNVHRGLLELLTAAKPFREEFHQ